MLSSFSTRTVVIARQLTIRNSRNPQQQQQLARSSSSRRWFASAHVPRNKSTSQKNVITSRFMTGAALTLAVAMSHLHQQQQQQSNGSHISWNAARLPSSGDVVSMGMPTTEKATGIQFPQLCNAMTLVGVGVRIKYVFVKVYAVGTYMDPIAMMAVKKGTDADIEKALLDPTYPRTIRLVMNRGLSIDKYTAAIVESLEPRMKGKDLDKLEDFKLLNPPVDLVEGAEIEMTIRGDTLLYKNAVGGVGTIKSQVFTEALCDTYYGKDPVSPTMKEDVLKGIRKL